VAENMNYETCYEILGLRFGASYLEVKQAYRFLSRRHHPDRFHGDELAQMRALRRQKELNQARDLLKGWFDMNPKSRPPRASARYRKTGHEFAGGGQSVYCEPGDVAAYSQEFQDSVDGSTAGGSSKTAEAAAQPRAARSDSRSQKDPQPSPASVRRSPHERFEGGFSILTLLLIGVILLAPMCSMALVLRTVVPVLSHGQLPDLLGQVIAAGGLAVSCRSLAWYFKGA